MSNPELLKNIPLFQALSIAERQKIANLMQKVSINAGAMVFRKGDPGDALYLVRSGSVEVLSSTGADEAGTGDVVAELGKGELFGEMAMVEGEPRSASVRAKADLKLWRINRKQFEDLLKSDNDLSLKIYKRLTVILSHRLRETTERLAIANDIIRMTSER